MLNIKKLNPKWSLIEDLPFIAIQIQIFCVAGAFEAWMVEEFPCPSVELFSTRELEPSILFQNVCGSIQP